MTSSFAAALKRLNPEQASAVESAASTVVLAGPGSGKTDTIVLKVAQLLERDVQAPRGVACLTYSNDAVREFSERLRRFGVRPERRLFLGTTHSFCMQRILQPFAGLCGRSDLTRPKLLSSAEQFGARQKALDKVGVGDDARYFEPTLTTIRRAIACGEDLHVFDDRHVDVARAYDNLLTAEQAVDFESMTLNALALLDAHDDLAALVAARYPWIAIDEYQDLGGPLHRLVLRLHDARINVFAVGDPDQCIFGFNGASPEYLKQLTTHPGFASITLRFNYRSGADLISAAQATLGETRPYTADPNREDRGTISLTNVPGGLDAQARYVVFDLIPALIAAGTKPDEIAVLYKQKGDLLDALVGQLDGSPLDFHVERDIRFPAGPTVRWMQQCAARAISPDDSDSLMDLIAGIPSGDRGLLDPSQELEQRQQLLGALKPVAPETPLHSWIDVFVSDTDLVARLQNSGTDSDSVSSIEQLKRPMDPPVDLVEFARGVSVEGRIVVTTCHSAKGRQFDVVVMPGLQRTLFPFERFINRAYVAKDPLGDRRLFYVGITRAGHDVHLLSSPLFTNRFGYDVPGRSPFLDELETRLNTGI